MQIERRQSRHTSRFRWAWRTALVIMINSVEVAFRVFKEFPGKFLYAFVLLIWLIHVLCCYLTKIKIIADINSCFKFCSIHGARTGVKPEMLFRE